MARFFIVLLLILGLSTGSFHICPAMSPALFSKKTAQPNFELKDKKKTPKKNPLLDKPYAILKETKNKARKANDNSTALKYLEAMLLAGDDTNHEEKQTILLELSDLYFEQKEWAKAERYYNEYILLYPGAQRCDYAHYKAILTGWNQTLDPERDQTKTQETLKKTEQFFTTYAASSYAPEVQLLSSQCYQKLFEADTYVFNFYCHNKNYKAAQKRLDIISKELIANLPDLQPQSLELSIQLANAQNNPKKALDAKLELAQKFPDHTITQRLSIDIPTIKLELAALEPIKNIPNTPTLNLAHTDILEKGASDILSKKMQKERNNLITSKDSFAIPLKVAENPENLPDSVETKIEHDRESFKKNHTIFQPPSSKKITT